jgi:hypothetical protein
MMRSKTSIFVRQRRALSALLLCVAFFGVVLHAGAQTAPLRVQILNGKTGRPLANQKIVVMGRDGVPSHAAHDFGSKMTDGEGYAALPELDSPLTEVQVFVEWHQPCSKTGKHDFSLAKVRVSGVVSENVCRPRITMYPQAGTLIFYVREETFIEKMRH